MPLLLSEGHNAAESQAQAQAAGARAAAMNADPGNAARYGGAAVQQRELRRPLVCASVLRAAAAVLPEGAVVDTTGAGDSFIGSVVYGLATGLGPAKILQVGALPKGLSWDSRVDVGEASKLSSLPPLPCSWAASWRHANALSWVPGPACPAAATWRQGCCIKVNSWVGI